MARIEILNPFGSRNREGVTHYMAKHHKHHYRRRHNPLLPSKDDLTLAAAGIVGGVGALALPAMLLPANNTGIVGYLMNAAAAIALKFAGDMVGPKTGSGMLVGGLVGTGIRIVRDNLPSIPLGAYWPSYFAVPTVSNGIGQVLSSPYPTPIPVAAATGKGMGRTDRFAARF
jgi:hypothetical protein